MTSLQSIRHSTTFNTRNAEENASSADSDRALSNHGTGAENSKNQPDNRVSKQGTDIAKERKSAENAPQTAGQNNRIVSRTTSQIDYEIDAILARKLSSADLDNGKRLRKKLSSIFAVEEAPAWRDIGEYEVLKRTKCRRVHSKLGQGKDLALFYKNEKFYAMEAWCSHMGGPLYEGDIEDYKGTCHIMCPWHAYMFELETGASDIGLKQQVFPVKVEDGHVYIEYISPLALYPFL